MHAPSVQPACGLLEVGPRAAASSACTAEQQSRCSGASACALPLPTPTASSPLMVSSVPKCCRRCRWPMSSSSHHLPTNLPNARMVCGGQHGSFMSGHEASPSMKGCLLGMDLRCVVPVRHSARDMCSTLPARRVDLSRFTMAVTRMYLPSSGASSDSIRVWMGPWRRRVRRDPSIRHGRTVSEAAVGGTRAWTALGHREVPK